VIVNLVGTAVVVAIVVAIGMYIDNKLRVDVKPEKLKDGNIKVRRVPVAQSAGDTPATAIRAGAAQLANLRAGQRCKECRALLEADAPDEELRYAGGALLLLHFRCPGCVRKRSLYVVPTA
jgi:hypothetical protein